MKLLSTSLTLSLLLLSFFGLVSWLITTSYWVMSCFTFIVYGIDKYKAKKDKTRVPESTLHIYALLCGWPGSVWGQTFFRHKTIKQPFRNRFHATIAVNLCGLFAYLGYPFLIKLT